MDERKLALMARAVEGTLLDRGVALWAEGRQTPWKLASLWSASHPSLKRLNSRKRRLVVETLWVVLRHHAMLAELAGNDAPETLWRAGLVKQGLAPELVGPEARWARVATADVAPLLEGRSPADAVALLGSMSPWLAAQLVVAMGDGALDFVRASNERAPFCLRVKRKQGQRQRVIGQFRGRGIRCGPTQIAPDGVVLEGRLDLTDEPLFRKGWLEPQDEGSQILAELVDPIGVVVDLCAGAGGKTLALADRADRMVATDVRRGALDELERRMSRARLEAEVHLLGADGALPSALAGLAADRVLVDAPCSGSGVLRRYPQHRWMITAERVAELSELQAQILHRASTLVKPGGRLIYGTCSVLPAENDAVVDAFLADHPEFTALPVSEVLGPAFGDRLRLAPHTHNTDGFFGAVLVCNGG
jgi:16S rRNA (cytosine967-C5)-methyltransferase